MGHLTVLMGCARSGKSTYAHNWISNGWIGKPRVVINSDAIRLALHGQRYCRLAEPFVHATTKVVIQALFNEGYHVMVDETNSTIGSIRRWLEIDSNAEFVYIDTPVEVCQKRAVATGQPDLVDVIPRMYNNLLDLCNYTIDKRILSGENMSNFRIDRVNEDDLMMSIETIREEMKYSGT